MLNKSKNYKSILFIVLISIFLVAGQSYLFSAYEAHVINVTARICKYSETRTIGFWKTHQEVYNPDYLPQFLGPTEIITPEAADEIFQNATAVDMSEMLRAQLLAMKFNIEHFGVGEYIVEGWGTASHIVDLADGALSTFPQDRELMEEIKNALNFVNNVHRLSHCLDIDPGTEAPVFVIQGAPEPSFSGEPFVAGVMMEPFDLSSEASAEEGEPPASGSENFFAQGGEPASASEPVEGTTVSSSEESQVSEEQGGVIEEIVETIETVVETVVEAVVEAVVEPVVEAVVEVVENLLGLEDESPIDEGSDEESSEPSAGEAEAPVEPIIEPDQSPAGNETGD